MRKTKSKSMGNTRCTMAHGKSTHSVSMSRAPFTKFSPLFSVSSFHTLFSHAMPHPTDRIRRPSCPVCGYFHSLSSPYSMLCSFTRFTAHTPSPRSPLHFPFPRHSRAPFCSIYTHLPASESPPCISSSSLCISHPIRPGVSSPSSRMLRSQCSPSCPPSPPLCSPPFLPSVCSPYLIFRSLAPLHSPFS